jgi:cytochrome c5
MYSYIFITHKFSVLAFLLLYALKTSFLLANKYDLLDKLTKITKVPEMIISTLFLATGVYMITQSPMVGTLTYVKIALVFASIPIAIIGFKKKNKVLASVSFVLIVGAYGLAEANKSQLKKAYQTAPVAVEAQSSLELGKAIYDQNCQMCHGPNGDLGLAGSANLKISALSDEGKKDIITKGKNSMPKFNYLKENELSAVVEYIGSFK